MELTAETPGRDKDLLEPKPRSPGQVLPGSLQGGPAQAGAAPPPLPGANGRNGDNGLTVPAGPAAPPRPWTVHDSAKLYGIRNWGLGYFSVTSDGHVAVHPQQDPAKSVDLKKLVDELRE